MLLLHYDACATVINGTAQTPKDVTQNPEIRSMLEGERHSLSTNFSTGMFSCQPAHLTCRSSIFPYELLVQRLNHYIHASFCLLSWTPAAERTEERKLEEELLDAAREGDLSALTRLVSTNWIY